MRRKLFLLLVLFLITSRLPILAVSFITPEGETNDTLDRQILYNGRAWRNLYYRIKGDQFLFSSNFLPGSVTISGKKFENIYLKYDIYNDELIIITERGIIIQLNKEMIDRFSLDYMNQIYNFKKLEADSINSLSGYFHVLYEGRTSLYIKYRKEILLLAVDNKYDMFNQVNKIYLEKDGLIEQVNSKRRLLNLIEDQKQQVHTFIKSNKIRLSRKDPEGFKPVIEYYDKLKN